MNTQGLTVAEIIEQAKQRKQREEKACCPEGKDTDMSSRMRLIIPLSLDELNLPRWWAVEGMHEETPDLATMPYDDYLQTEAWQEHRKQALAYAGYRCQVCNTDEEALHVHHRTYERRGQEKPQDLIVLCASCHALFHGKLL
jgi:5-methylcytosine-specific restriction endonuclease McrA